MSQSNMSPVYSSQNSNSSIDDEKTFGVRVIRKAIPTLETGRRSKHLVLFGAEAVRRDKRRERNRLAAKRLKEKRQQIEDELNQKIHELENQHSHLKSRVTQLDQRKQHLLTDLNEQLLNELDEIISEDHQTSVPESEQYSLDMNLFDDAFEEILNSYLLRCT